MSTIEKQGRLIDDKNATIECLEQNVYTLKSRVLQLEVELEQSRQQIRLVNALS